MILTSTSIAENNGDQATSYTDKVTDWGAWELDIEPAAGGLTQTSSDTLQARDAKVKLRGNSISALAPRRPPTPPVVSTPSVIKVPHGGPGRVPFGGPANRVF